MSDSSVGWATISVIPSFDGFRDKLERGTSSSFAAVGRSGGDKFGASAADVAGKKFNSRFGSILKAGAFAGVAAGAAGAFAAFRFGAEALEEAREAAKVGKLTNAVIKSTGGAAKISGRQVGDLAGKLSEMAGVDDELVQEGANVILTFTKIRNEAGKGNKVFDQATLAALNMSAALGTDLKGSSIQVGKALNDPIKGVTALGRAGVQFTEQQKDQIKTLVTSGDTLKAQKIILGELDTQFKGAARSQADSSDRLSVAFGNIKEEIGGALLPAVDDLADLMLDKGVPAAQQFAEWFNKDGVNGLKKFGGFVRDDVIPAGEDLFDTLQPLAKSALPALSDGFKTARGVLEDVVPLAKDMVDAFNEMPDWAKTALIGGGGALALGKKFGALGGGKGGPLGGNGGGALALFTKAKPIPVFVVNEGFGDGPAGKKGWLAALTAFGTPAAIAGLGGAAAGSVTPTGDRNQMAPGSAGYAGDGGLSAPSGWLDFREDTEKAKRSFGVMIDASVKLKSRMSEGSEAIRYFHDQIDKLPTHSSTLFNTPGLGASEDAVKRYKGILDGLDGRVVKTFIENRQSKIDAQLLRFGGPRANGGTVSPSSYYLVGERGPELFAPQSRGRIIPNGDASGVADVRGNKQGGVHFHGDIHIHANTYEDILKKLQQRARVIALNGAGGGIRF